MFWCHSIAFQRNDSQDFSVYGMGPTTAPLSIDLMTHWAKESSNRWGSTRYRNRPMCCKSRYPCPHNESLTRRSPRLNAAFSRGAVYIVLFFWVAETSLSRCAAAIDKNGGASLFSPCKHFDACCVGYFALAIH